MSEMYLVSGPEIDVGNFPLGGLGQLFLEALKTNADKVAQIDSETDQYDTFGDMLERCIRTAIHLKKRGIKPQDIISICSSNNLNNGVTFIAAQFIGAVPAHLDPTLSLKETIYLLNQVKPKIIFVSENGLEVIEKAVKITELNSEIVIYGKSYKHTEFEEFLIETEEQKKFEITPISNIKDTALILFTSGSSGYPKGVCLSHYSLTSLPNLQRHVWNLDSEYLINQKPFRTLLFTTLYWISAVCNLITSIAFGTCRILCKQYDAEKTLDLFEKYEVNYTFIGPSQAAEFYNLNRKTFINKSPLRIQVGGGFFSADQMIKLRNFFPKAIAFQVYGQTELAGALFSFNNSNETHRKFIREKPASCGVIVAGTIIKIVDPETEAVRGYNCPGELRVQTKYGMNGYYNMDSSDVYDSSGWMKTGDIAYYDEDRCFYIVGRLKETFKYRGWHVRPAVLEAELLDHPAVKYAVVFGTPHETDGDHPTAVVVLNEESQATAEEILEFANSRLSDRQQLRGGLTIVDSLPITPTGKIKKREVKELLLQLNSQNCK